MRELEMEECHLWPTMISISFWIFFNAASSFTSILLRAKVFPDETSLTRKTYEKPPGFKISCLCLPGKRRGISGEITFGNFFDNFYFVRPNGDLSSYYVSHFLLKGPQMDTYSAVVHYSRHSTIRPPRPQRFVCFLFVAKRRKTHEFVSPRGLPYHVEWLTRQASFFFSG